MCILRSLWYTQIIYSYCVSHTLDLLSRYDLMQFSEVVEAVKAGNLLSLNEALDKNEKFFIKNGIFLILEKLKIITYRFEAHLSIELLL